MKCEVNHEIAAVRWLDNKAVQLLSTFIADESIGTCRRWSAKDKKIVDIARLALVAEYNKYMRGVGTCRRWSAKDKKIVDIARLALVAEYNKYMRGVDLSDMLMELYKINHRSAKWYTRLGTAVTNSWLLYRKHLKMVEPN
ncbi:Transposase IS4 [Popillia japonica]|uniref:Transposase IS4 n=1 Tax=Popillia japonica TaxID=7064 RepID=A0AAW1LSN4_POPJA